jgi:hypothetical protein
MYSRLKKLVNKVRAYGTKTWSGHMLVKRMLRAYAPKDMTVIALIHQDPTYKEMTPDDVLGRIINHEMFLEEVDHIKNLSNGILTSKRQYIALKASKKSKSKQVVVDQEL